MLHFRGETHRLPFDRATEFVSFDDTYGVKLYGNWLIQEDPPAYGDVSVDLYIVARPGRTVRGTLHELNSVLHDSNPSSDTGAYLSIQSESLGLDIVGVGPGSISVHELDIDSTGHLFGLEVEIEGEFMDRSDNGGSETTGTITFYGQ